MHELPHTDSRNEADALAPEVPGVIETVNRGDVMC